MCSFYNHVALSLDPGCFSLFHSIRDHLTLPTTPQRYCVLRFKNNTAVFIHYAKHIHTHTEFLNLYPQLQLNTVDTELLVKTIIQLHRPIQFLNCFCCTLPSFFHLSFCDLALKTLRDPTTGGGTRPWNEQTCFGPARYGHLETLIWLGNPAVGGGACPWYKHQCLNIAQKHNHTHIATWICVQHGNNP